MEVNPVAIPVKPPRHFLPADLVIDSWQKVQPFFADLRDRKIRSAEELKEWLRQWSELEAVLSEESAWRYVRMSCDTMNPSLTKAYNFFVTEIDPKAAPFTNEFGKKLMASPFLEQLGSEYAIFLKRVKNSLAIFREENIPLFVEIEVEKQKYAQVTSEMTIRFGGGEITMQKAASLLKDPDRAVRGEVFRKVVERRERDDKTLTVLFDRLVQLQHRAAENAGFRNFRDYKFVQLNRFDYTADDCFHFHDSIQREVCPVADTIDLERKKRLGLDALRPWDAEAEPQEPLRPFGNADELIEKTIECFYRVRPFFGECLGIMRAMRHLDLDSRIGKAPGGFNYPLYEIGVPFVFMNSVGSLRDLITIVHEGGHAVHSFLTRDLELTDFKNLPSEVAELASMSMELISMEHWDVFFPDTNDLKRARREQLEKLLKGLASIARGDKFQHWVFEHPGHTANERNAYWKKISIELGSKVVDWTGFEEDRERSWQGILHFYEVPFYYIEYGFAQLGAIAVWKNYKSDPEKAIDDYERALRLGYTRSIPEFYRAAGVEFDFSRVYMRELVQFVRSELEKLY